MSNKRKTRINSGDITVLLPNGESRLVYIRPDPESSYDMLYSPKRMNGEGYGVVCSSLERAITFMYQWDCSHNIIPNDVISDDPQRWTPLPYKCTICNKHFIHN